MKAVLDRHRRWLIFGTLFSAHALTVGSTSYSFGLFIEPLEAEFGWQRTAIAASLSFLAIGSLLSPVIGRLIDLYGARPIMTSALALVGLSFLLRPLMTELSHWYALSLMQFVAMAGASAMPSGRLIPIWFQSTQGRVMGFTTMGINVGGIILPFLVTGLLRTASWEFAYVALGVISLVIALSALLFIRDRTGRETFGDAETQSTNNLAGFTLGHALRTRSFYAIVVAVMLGSFAHAGVLPQLPNFFMTKGASGTIAALTVSVMAVSGLISKPTFGYLSERITARLAMMTILSGQAVALMIMVLVPSVVVAWVALPLFGVGMGAHSALFPLLVREAFGGRNVAGIMGTVAISTVLPFGLGPILAGASFDLTDGYELAFVGFAVLFAVAAAVQIQIRPFVRKVEV